MQKVIFFTANAVGTEAELASIANLNALAEPRLNVVVRNGSDQIADNGYSSGPEPADAVAGTVPEEYEDYPVIDPDSEAASVVDGATTVVVDTGGHNSNATVSVAGGSLDGVVLSQTNKTILTNSDEFTDAAGTYEFTVAGGEITAIDFTPV